MLTNTGGNHFTIQPLLLLLSHFSRVRLCDPIGSSPPGSPVPGILQARTLEWDAIAFSNAWKWSRSVMSDSHVATPRSAAYQAPPSMGFSRQEYWSGVPLPSPLQYSSPPLSLRDMFQDLQGMLETMDSNKSSTYYFSLYILTYSLSELPASLLELWSHY